MVTIVSWNTLESGQGGAWADGWGCPLEIQRWKEELVQWKKRKQIHTNNTISSDSGGSTTTTTTTTLTTEEEEEEAKSREIKRLLTNQRYARIRNTIINEMNDNAIDFYLFQELTEGNTWDEYFNTNNDTNNNITNIVDRNDNDHRFEFESESEFTQFPPSTYERVPCQEDDDNDNDSGGGGDNDNDKTVQRIYVRTESGWKSKRSYTLHSDVLEGGCLVEFQQQQQQHSPLGVDHGTGNEDNEDNEEEEEKRKQQLFLVNLHGNSKKMRDPHLRRRGIMELWKEIGSYLNTHTNNNRNENKNENENESSSSSSSWWWLEKIIVCGDFNTHLSELITPTRHYLTTAADSNENNKNNNHNSTISGSSSPVVLEPVVGLLRNSTATTGQIPVFSTNHEAGFLAQYDGCLFFRHNPHPNSDVTTATTTPTTTNTPISSSEPVPLSSIASSSIVSSSSSIVSSSSSSYLELENVSWNLTGFMPKGHGKLPGRSSSEQQQEEHPYYNNFTYHSSHRDGDDDAGIYLNGIFLGSGTVPSFGMSDHLRIYTTIRIHNHHHNHNNDHPIKEHKYQYEHQRRPPRHYSDTYN